MTGMRTHDDKDISQTLGLNRESRGIRHPWRWIGLGLLLAGGVGLSLLRGNDAANGLTYTTQEIHRGDLVATVTATGNLEPTNQVDVGIEVSGTIASVDVDYNDHVEVGQPLARLDTSKLEAQVNKSTATLASARAQVGQARATLTESSQNLERLRRMHEMSGGKLPSQQDLDTAEATYARAQTALASAQAAVAEAEATLKVNQTDLDKAVIRSPINGIVLSRAVEPGQTVAASFQAPVLFTLAEDLTKMELHVDVDEADVGQVHEGQTATFTVDAYPERTFPARVTQVRYGAQEVDGVITYETLLNVDNTDLALRPGMTATADIIVQKVNDALLVPNAALRFTPPVQTAQSGGGSMLSKLMPRPPRSAARAREVPATDKTAQRVWVLRNGVPVEVPIHTGATDGIFTQVVSGDIEPGEAVIVDAVSKTRK